MTHDTRDDRALDQLFEAARSAPPELTPELRRRLDRDIEEAVGGRQPTPSVGQEWRWRLRDWLPAAGGLVAATVCGVAIGLNSETTPLPFSLEDTGDVLDLSAFVTGADPGVFFLDEDGL